MAITDALQTFVRVAAGGALFFLLRDNVGGWERAAIFFPWYSGWGLS